MISPKALSRRVSPQEADLFLISAFALFAEVLVIRWLPSTVQISAYFTNLVLLCAFLGLGVGCLLADKKLDLMNGFPFALLALIGLAQGFSSAPAVVGDSGEHFLGFYGTRGQPYLVLLLTLAVFVTGFFVPLGQELGRRMRSFAPLKAYSVNILGSLAGTLLFWALSACQTPPILWFSVLLALSARFAFRTASLRWMAVLCVLLGLFLLDKPSSERIWSPYYRIDLARAEDARGRPFGYGVLVNQMFHQYALDLSKDTDEYPQVKNAAAVYRFPYRWTDPRTVLVLGAGSGNDVATALREGVERVDAVEIDPAIAGLGRWLHPQKPYTDPRVRLIVDDARSQLNRSGGLYDLIVFGYLDSHRLFSSFSAVRMDNFIYTVEAFRAAQKRLAPDGMVALTYLAFQDWIVSRLEQELRGVFGDAQVRTYLTQTYEPNDTAVFLAGPGVDRLPDGPLDGFTRMQGRADPVEPATDDWPYLYVHHRHLPAHYLWALFGLLGVAAALSLTAGPPLLRRSFGFPAHFILGAGFMLLETKAITRASILYGSTWTVSAAVIVLILVMILAANAWVAGSRPRFGVCSALLVFFLAAEWLVSPSAQLALPPAARWGVSALVLGLPVFFAAALFAVCFEPVSDASAALASNLAGAMVGGVLEYTAMVTGFAALSWLAIALYAAAFFTVRRWGFERTPSVR